MLANKMIRPTTIPQTLEELIIEHSVAREALRLGLQHHKTIATRLKGMKLEDAMTRGSVFDQELEETYIKMMEIDIIAGTGGLLSHAPDRIQSIACLMDAFQPEGVTWVFQDSVFMMPHLGILSTVDRDAAWNIFNKDCLIRLGTVIAPNGKTQRGEKIMTVNFNMSDGTTLKESVNFGEIKRLPLSEGEEIEAIIEPSKNFDMGATPGHIVKTNVMGGVCGVILDGRGRPLELTSDGHTRRESLKEWYQALRMYPSEQMIELL